jgi:hypothetical protein
MREGSHSKGIAHSRNGAQVDSRCPRQIIPEFSTVTPSPPLLGNCYPPKRLAAVGNGLPQYRHILRWVEFVHQQPGQTGGSRVSLPSSDPSRRSISCTLASISTCGTPSRSRKQLRQGHRSQREAFDLFLQPAHRHLSGRRERSARRSRPWWSRRFANFDTDPKTSSVLPQNSRQTRSRKSEFVPGAAFLSGRCRHQNVHSPQNAANLTFPIHDLGFGWSRLLWRPFHQWRLIIRSFSIPTWPSPHTPPLKNADTERCRRRTCGPAASARRD